MTWKDWASIAVGVLGILWTVYSFFWVRRIRLSLVLKDGPMLAVTATNRGTRPGKVLTIQLELPDGNRLETDSEGRLPASLTDGQQVTVSFDRQETAAALFDLNFRQAMPVFPVAKDSHGKTYTGKAIEIKPIPRPPTAIVSAISF